MKKIITFSTLVACGVLLGACGTKKEQPASPQDSTAKVAKTAQKEKTSISIEKLDQQLSLNGKSKVFVEENAYFPGVTLSVEGTAKGSKASSKRELALYQPKSNGKVAKKTSLQVDDISVESNNFLISYGTVKGNVHVDATNFQLKHGAKIEGNLTFSLPHLLEEFNKLPH